MIFSTQAGNILDEVLSQWVRLALVLHCTRSVVGEQLPKNSRHLDIRPVNRSQQSQATMVELNDILHSSDTNF